MQVMPVISFRQQNWQVASNKSAHQPMMRNNGVQTNFLGLLPKNAKIKIAFFDIDETLKNWNDNLPEKTCSKLRNKLFKHLKSNNILSAYTSDRGLNQILPLIEDGTLAKPDWIVGNNGGRIYKNVKGKFEEITEWSTNRIKSFDKEKIRGIMAKIANKEDNMFPAEEWAKIPPEQIPEGQKEFRRSKMTEYIGHESPMNMRIVMAPGVYEKNIDLIKKELKENRINPVLTLFHYPPATAEYDGLRKYFDHEKALILENHIRPRLFPDGSYNTLLISATDKGMASEYIRKTLKIKKNEVFAVGDGENDFSNANKKYYFALISNAVDGLKRMLNQTDKTNIIEATKPGVEGILEVLV